MSSKVTTSDLNLLVMRYLQESGFKHSAFVFASESLVGSSESATADLPLGALVGFVHRGLLYKELEMEVRASLCSTDSVSKPHPQQEPSKRLRGAEATAASLTVWTVELGGTGHVTTSTVGRYGWLGRAGWL